MLRSTDRRTSEDADRTSFDVSSGSIQPLMCINVPGCGAQIFRAFVQAAPMGQVTGILTASSALRTLLRCVGAVLVVLATLLVLPPSLPRITHIVPQLNASLSGAETTGEVVRQAQSSPAQPAATNIGVAGTCHGACDCCAGCARCSKGCGSASCSAHGHALIIGPSPRPGVVMRRFAAPVPDQGPDELAPVRHFKPPRA